MVSRYLAKTEISKKYQLINDMILIEKLLGAWSGQVLIMTIYANCSFGSEPY